MTVLIPQDDNPLGESFASMLSNEISGVQFINDKVWVVVSPAGDITSWLIPLLCPVCGGAWHFNAENIQEIVAELREKLTGFTLAGMHYHTGVTEQGVRAIRQRLIIHLDGAPHILDVDPVGVYPCARVIQHARADLMRKRGLLQLNDEDFIIRRIKTGKQFERIRAAHRQAVGMEIETRMIQRLFRVENLLGVQIARAVNLRLHPEVIRVNARVIHRHIRGGSPIGECAKFKIIAEQRIGRIAFLQVIRRSPQRGGGRAVIVHRNAPRAAIARIVCSAQYLKSVPCGLFKRGFKSTFRLAEYQNSISARVEHSPKQPLRVFDYMVAMFLILMMARKI